MSGVPLLPGVSRSGRVRESRPTAVLAAAGIALWLLAGCTAAPPPAAQPDRAQLEPARFSDLAGWTDDDVAAALPALQRSCRALGKAEDAHALGANGIGGTIADWRGPCADLAAATPATLRPVLEADFRPLHVVGRDGPEGLFTGYYEPELRGALAPDARFRVPLYGTPDDLVLADLGEFRGEWRGQRLAGRVVDGRLHPYQTRAEIEAGGLGAHASPLVWVDDADDAFFLAIQGSGRVALPDGRIVRLGYAAQNGRPYLAIGRALIDNGALKPEAVTMPAIRAWLSQHPDQAPALRNLNQSYVFFRILDGDGPIGALGTVLTPGRSLAVDPAFLPLGAPVWLDIELPGQPQGRLRRLVVAEDVGGAIRGPVRGDLFWGAGPDAAERAGSMKQRGGYWLLLPRTVAERVARN